MINLILILIYIDACHDSQYVMTDAMLSWKVLKVGGYLIFDDYGWNLLKIKNQIMLDQNCQLIVF